MQKRKSTGSQMIAEAMALFVRNEAALLAQVAETSAEFRRNMAESERRFARIEAELEQIKTILRRHEQILNDLPEMIRQKIGFQPRQ